MYLANAEINKVSSNRNGWTFSLSLRFGEEVLEFKKITISGIKKNKIYIGLKSARIHFLLTDCELPSEDWMWDNSIELQRAVSRDVSVSKQSQSGITQGLERSFDASADLGLDSQKIGSSFSEKTSSDSSTSRDLKVEIRDSFKKKQIFVSASGNSRNPKWVIEAPIDEDYLKGHITENRFARADVIGPNPRIIVQLDIPDFSLVVRDEGGVFQGINKTKIAKIRIKKALTNKMHDLFDLNLDSGQNDE
jgi:hypothetical protein